MLDFESCNKIPFVFKATRTCLQNLRAFIEHAKTKLDLFSGAEGYAWELMTWDVSYMLKKRAETRLSESVFRASIQPVGTKSR